MKTPDQLYYIDPQGRRWNVESVDRSDMPNFYRVTHIEDGKTVLIYRAELKVEEKPE